MEFLNANKPMLLNQVRRNPNVSIDDLIKLIQTYGDLSADDFKGIVSDVVYEQLKEADRDPEEKNLWERICSAPRNTVDELKSLQMMTKEYLHHYPSGPEASQVQNMMNRIPDEMTHAMERDRMAKQAAKEENDWLALDRGNYNTLANYRNRYPQSAHLSELDDLMWANVKAASMNGRTLNRYLSDWPNGNHADEANRALSEISTWEEVKRSGDIFMVDDYRDNHPDSPFINDVNIVYYDLRDKELAKMKEMPTEYSKDDVERLITADIFKKWELEDEGLITDASWEALQLDRNLFPQIQDYQFEDPNLTASEGCTDVYLFGTPGTGKTCLLMGLAGANGRGYTLNMKVAGGPYASALQQYVNAGITPGRTFGHFVTTINGQIQEPQKNGVLNHRINLVEMSGEEFALRIADGQGVSLSDMGTGATNLLRNNNRKVFFVIVDCSRDMVKVEYVEPVRDTEGNIIEERVRKKYISQLDILGKFVGLFELPENQEIMKKVDAIHFVVTKADMLGNIEERKEAARQLLREKYTGPIESLKSYCRQTKRVNYSTGYKPQVFTFSLGKFFLGDVFEFDPSETVQIINTIRAITTSTSEETWIEIFVNKIFG